VQIQTAIKIDFVMVDYLDLVMPVSVKVNPNDQFIKDKYVAEELRNLAKELGILLVTASQLNRCLTLDTIVIANGSPVEIQNVKIGDWIESNEGPVQVQEKLPVTKQPVYKITTKSGKIITCSANHKFPSDNGLLTLGTGLKVGDKLIGINR
jgi:intein/homing endonuclease